MNTPYHGTESGHGQVESHHQPRPGMAAATGALLLAGFATLLLSGRPEAIVPFILALAIMELPWLSFWRAQLRWRRSLRRGMPRGPQT